MRTYIIKESELKKYIRDIISEVFQEALTDEDENITISPDMNLGVTSIN